MEARSFCDNDSIYFSRSSLFILHEEVLPAYGISDSCGVCGGVFDCFFYLFSKNSASAIGWGNLLLGIMGTANYYLMRFRGAPFQLSDFKATKTAGNVVNNYDFTPTSLLVIALTDFILWYVVWKMYLKDEKRDRYWHPCKKLGTVVLSLGIIALPMIHFQEIYANTTQFAQDTYLSMLVAEIMGSTKSLPDDYSVEEVENIVEHFRKVSVDGSIQQNDVTMLPNIVVMFGDHQPRLEDEFYKYLTGQPMYMWTVEQRMNQYKTPFIIWHNYDAESVDLGDVSLSYLTSILLENAGLNMSEYQQFVLEQYLEMPVVNAIGMIDAEGIIFSKGSPEYQKLSEDYRMLIYNHTADKENRWNDFYSIGGR